MIVFVAGAKYAFGQIPTDVLRPMVLLVCRLRGDLAGLGEEYLLASLGRQTSVSAVLELCEECSYSGYRRMEASGLMQPHDGSIGDKVIFTQHQGELAGALFYWERRKGDDVSEIPFCYMENISVTVGSPPAAHDVCVAIPRVVAQ